MDQVVRTSELDQVDVGDQGYLLVQVRQVVHLLLVYLVDQHNRKDLVDLWDQFVLVDLADPLYHILGNQCNIECSHDLHMSILEVELAECSSIACSQLK